MTSTTSRYAILKPSGTDPVRDGDNTISTALDRIDYLLGETGEWVSPSATGTSSAVVNLSRAYPGGFDVTCSLKNSTVAGVVELWARQNSVGGGPGGVAQMDIGINMSAAAARTVVYKIHPKP